MDSGADPCAWACPHASWLNPGLWDWRQIVEANPMDFGLEDAADPVADLLRIVDLLSARPPDWQELLRADRHRSTVVTFVNPLSLLTARRSPGFLDELARFDLVLPDSIVLARLASALRREPIARRSFDGNSLAPMVFALCRERSLRVGLVGGRPRVAETAAGVFADAFGVPGALAIPGFFRDRAQRRNVLRSIIDRGLDVVVCGMGTGAQERFLLDLVDEGWTGLGFTCGGYLDQAARAGARYYPAAVDALHLRAAYRMCREPWRLVPRYTRDYLRFYRAMFAVTAGRTRVASVRSGADG